MGGGKRRPGDSGHRSPTDGGRYDRRGGEYGRPDDLDHADGRYNGLRKDPGRWQSLLEPDSRRERQTLRSVELGTCGIFLFLLIRKYLFL